MLKRLAFAAVFMLGAGSTALADGAQEARPAAASAHTPASRRGTGMGTNPTGGSQIDGRAGMPPRAEQLAGPHSTAPVGVMRYYEVTRLDPLTGNTMDSPGTSQTPFMAGSTGLWAAPPAGSPQSEWKTRATGVEDHSDQ